MATTIRIGHASISERGTAYGQAGDSTGKEVYIVENYDIVKNLKPTVLLRPKNPELAEKSAKACEDGCVNNNIGYSQDSRNTLYSEASKVDFDLSKITAKCNCDCSSFMTVCAIAGGAEFYNSGNAPTTSTMRSDFIRYGEYEALTATEYLTSVNLLKRGDILVKEGTHTIMVLGTGSEADFTNTLDIDISTIKVTTKLTDVQSNKITAVTEIAKMENGVATKAESADIGLYNWSYSIRSLIDSKATPDSEKLEIKTASKEFSISNLKPNHSYALKVTATEIGKTSSISSSEIIFTTPQSYPTAVRNLDVESTTKNFNGKFTISFDAPTSWGSNSLTKCYRLHLFVNGKSVAHSDDLLKSNSAYEKEEIVISKITNKENLYTLGDTVQLGIQTGMKDGSNFICDPHALRCSQPLFIETFLKPIDRIYVKIKNNYKLAIVHNNK